MASIIYYSNFCEPSKRLLQTVSKTNICNSIHFICIDKRVKEQNNTYAILPNGQKMIIPPNITNVPAMLLINGGGQVIYGDQIYKHLQSSIKQEVKKATQQNLEPVTFQDGYRFGNGGNHLVTSDSYSYLDADLDVKNGTGGLQQMHQYVAVNDFENHSITQFAPSIDGNNGGKLKEGDVTIDQLIERRNAEMNQFNSSQPRKMW